ncbi:MAG: hypothetical protein OHK0012_22530 [Synechococcales cyanobacterium]
MRPLLIFDAGVILAGKADLWQEWVLFGLCVLPQGVAQALQATAAAGGEEEQIARAFWRWQPHSEMVISAATNLAFPVQEGMSQRRRLEEQVVDSASALAHQHSSGLVVVVSDETRVRQRVLGLGVQNLAAISGAELRRWMREQQRPEAVVDVLRRFPGVPVPLTRLIESSGTMDVTSPPSPHRRPAPQPQTAGQGVSGTATGRRRTRTTPWMTVWQSLILLVSLGLLGGSGLVVWRIVDPVGSESFWVRWQLPDIPGIPK